MKIQKRGSVSGFASTPQNIRESYFRPLRQTQDQTTTADKTTNHEEEVGGVAAGLGRLEAGNDEIGEGGRKKQEAK